MKLHLPKSACAVYNIALHAETIIIIIAIVAATLAVSQERKSFTTNHTSILKIVRFNAQNVAQFDA